MSTILQRLGLQSVKPKDKLGSQPYPVLRHILNNLDFKSILTLRKVSRDLRDFIDFVGCESGLSDVIITIYAYKVRFNFEPYSEFAQIEYKKEYHGCLISWYDENEGMRREKFIRRENFVKMAVDDLNINLNLQKSTLPVFRIVFKQSADEGEDQEIGDLDTMHNVANEFLCRFKNKMKSRNGQLKVKSFIMKSENLKQHHVMAVLPYLKPETLENIEFLCDYPFYQGFQYRDHDRVDVNGLVDLGQWKNAKKIVNQNFCEAISIQDFCAFKNVHFIFQSINSSYLKKLKEILFHSKTYEHFIIEYLHFYDISSLQELLGKPMNSEDHRTQQWYFWNPDFDFALQLSVSRSRFVVFSRLKLTEIPHNANVS